MIRFLKNLVLTILLSLPLVLDAQCDVYIVPGSVEVSDNGQGVMFTFDVTNGSDEPWTGDDILMYWSLNSGANIMSITYGDGSDLGHPPPLAPGETETFSTPWMAIPNLPDWYPQQPTDSVPWQESMDWPYYTLPFPFSGSWSPVNLRLASCGLADGAWIFNEEGEPYYGPTGNETCNDNNNDAFCDCEIVLSGYNPQTHDVTIDVVSALNCGCNYITDDNGQDCYDATTGIDNEEIDHFVFGLHVQSLDQNWLSCMQAEWHPGWVWTSLSSFAQGWQSGETVNATLDVPECWETIIALAPNSLCLEMVVWQINFSQTASLDDFVNGWASTCGLCQGDTHQYPDIDISDNNVVWCFNENPPDPEIPGCTDPQALNYDELATEEDGSCFYIIEGCVDPVACNYNDTATDDDGSCIYCDPAQCIWVAPWCYGCLDPTAVNYSEEAQIDDGSCEYEEAEDSYTDAKPIFYDAGPDCEDNEPFIETYTQIQNIGNDTIFTYCISIPEIGYDECFDGYDQIVYFIEPGGGQMIYFPPIPIDMESVTINVYNVNDEPESLEWNNSFEINFSHSEGPQDCLEASVYDYDAELFCDETGSYYVPTIIYQNTGIDTITDICIELDLYGTMYEEQVCWSGSALPNQSISITFPPIYVSSIGMYLDVVSINGEQTNTEPEVVTGVTQAWINEAEELCAPPLFPDGSIDSLSIVEGCDEFTPYWQPTLEISNVGGLDIFDFCVKFNVLGQYLDTLCFNLFIPAGASIQLEWPEPIYSYGTISIHMLDVNGESSQPWDDFGNDESIANNMFTFIVGNPTINCDVLGCTDQEANNYDEAANVDDGSCEYDVTELTYITAECSVDCDLSGPFYYVITTWTNTGDVEITNFCAEWDVLGGEGDVQECYNGSLMPGDTVQLQFGPYSTDGSPVAWAYLQVINGVELVPQIENYETLYCYGDAEASCVYGCTDQEANNYDATADVDDGSCTYDILGCTDPQANNYNPEANVDDGSCTFDVLGCTDPVANNYDPLANVDDDSCQYDVLGCTDSNALNFNPFANVDDGSCLYYDPCGEDYVPVYVPNVFTPNGDGINDVWQIITNAGCWESWSIKIFNRWGNMIYEMTNTDEVWDGTTIGGDNIVSDGVYICTITATRTNAGTYKNTTEITVFR